VDDFLLLSSSPSPTACAEIVDELKGFYNICFLSPIKTFLGVNVEQDEKSITMSMPLYIATCLERFDLLGIYTKKSPMIIDLDKHDGSDKPELLDREGSSNFRSMVGALLFLTNTCRPDVDFASSCFLARSMASPTSSALDTAKRVWLYLAGSTNQCLLYRSSKACEEETLPHLVAYVDSDWATDLERRCSTTGYVFFFAGAPVSWRSSLQSITTLSSTEAEYLALADAGKEAIYFCDIINDLGIIKVDAPLLLFEDNKGAIDLAHNPKFHSRTKHIDIRHHFIRDYVEHKVISIQKVGTTTTSLTASPSRSEALSSSSSRN